MAILAVPYFRQETDDTCAPACLRMALAFRFPNGQVMEAELARRCRCEKGEGCAADDVFRAARRYRLAAVWLENQRIEEEVDAALGAGCPVLANTELRGLPYLPSLPDVDQDAEFWHSVLIIGLDEQYVYLHDPAPQGGARRAIERESFFAGWEIHGDSAYRL